MITTLALNFPPVVDRWWDISVAMFYIGLDYTLRFPVLPRKDI